MISHRYTYVLIAIIAFCIGALSFTTLVSLYKYKKVRMVADNVVTLFTTASTLRYGVVDSVDTERRLLTMTTRRAGIDEQQQVLVHVPEGAVIAHEALEENDGVYDTLSQRTPASLSDIHAGDRAAVQLRRSGEQFVADIVLFGNPL